MMQKKKAMPAAESEPKVKRATAPKSESFRPIRIEIASDLYNLVDQVAEHEGMNRTTYIRRLILKDLRERGKLPS